jgi:hypothetical protein
MEGDRKCIEILSRKEATGEYRKKFLLRPKAAVLFSIFEGMDCLLLSGQNKCFYDVTQLDLF